MTSDLGGESACWAHLLDDEGRLESPRRWGLVQVHRIYEPPNPDDGYRVLVDRLWPRGLKKESSQLDDWLRNIAPSNVLRTWYGHNPERWLEFAQRYREELQAAQQAVMVADLARRVRLGTVTLLCATRDPAHSNAEVLCQLLLEQVPGARRAGRHDI